MISTYFSPRVYHSFPAGGSIVGKFRMLKLDSSLYHVLHGILIATTLYVTYLSQPGSSLFSWHPFLMTLSVIPKYFSTHNFEIEMNVIFFSKIKMFLLMNEAVLLFSTNWSLLPKKYHRSQYMNGHIALEVLSVIGVLLGFYSIYLNKDTNGKVHFTSWHGTFGLVQVVAICSQVVIGSLAKYRILPVKSYPTAKLKTLHGVLGVSIILLAVVNLSTGWYTSWFINNSSMFMCVVLSIFCACINMFTSLRAIGNNSRIKNLFK